MAANTTFNIFTGPLKRLLLLVVILLAGLVSCRKKEKYPENFISASTGTYKFFASGKTVNTYKGAGATSSSLTVEGVMASGATLRIWIRDYASKPGVLSLDSVDASASFLPVTPSVERTSAHGVLTIKTITPALTGTFNFTCTDSSVVEGSFSVVPK